MKDWYREGLDSVGIHNRYLFKHRWEEMERWPFTKSEAWLNAVKAARYHYRHHDPVRLQRAAMQRFLWGKDST